MLSLCLTLIVIHLRCQYTGETAFFCYIFPYGILSNSRHPINHTALPKRFVSDHSNTWLQLCTQENRHQLDPWPVCACCIIAAWQNRLHFLCMVCGWLALFYIFLQHCTCFNHLFSASNNNVVASFLISLWQQEKCLYIMIFLPCTLFKSVW